MSKNPNLGNLLPLFESNSDFSLTETQYEQMTGANLPQRKKYIEADSALSKLAQKYGYKVIVQKRTVLCEKISEGEQE